MKFSLRAVNRWAAAIVVLLLVTVLVTGLSASRSEAGDDNEIVFDLAPGSGSQVYTRPEKADYFWWDTVPADRGIRVQLVFADGSAKEASAQDEFSARIVSVKFINPL